MSNSEKCLLKDYCKLADSSSCTIMCQHWISLQGSSGVGGRIGLANVPLDYRMYTLKNNPVRESQQVAYKTIDAYVDTFIRMFEDSNERIKSLYLFSYEPGTGKTSSATVTLNEWIIRHYIGSLQRGIRPLEKPAYFLDLNAWQTDYNTMTRQGVPQDTREMAGQRYYRNMETAKTVPLLVADDLAVRSSTDGFRGDLHTLINYRVSNHLPVVYTSNVPLSELSTVFGEERLADRVRDQCLQIAFKGESNRGMRK